MVLSKEEQLGLTGELAALSMLAEEIGFVAAVDAWKGPIDGLHDFARQGGALEVKAALGASQRIYVSTLDQLSNAGASLTLVRPRFRESPQGRSLPETVALLRAAIAASSPGALIAFDELLLRARFVNVQPEDFDAFRVEMDGVYGFAVTEDFPSMPLQALPAAIVGGAYVLDEGALGAFRLDSATLRTAFHALGDIAA